jgi:hypothetical protein
VTLGVDGGGAWYVSSVISLLTYPLTARAPRAVRFRDDRDDRDALT